MLSRAGTISRTRGRAVRVASHSRSEPRERVRVRETGQGRAERAASSISVRDSTLRISIVCKLGPRGASGTSQERSGASRVVARAAAVGNAVAACQVIVIGTAVPLSPFGRPSRRAHARTHTSTRTHDRLYVCAWLSHTAASFHARVAVWPRAVVDALDFCGVVGGTRCRGGPTLRGRTEVE